MIKIKTEKEIGLIRESCKRLAEIMRELKKVAVPGITTNELNKVAEDLVSTYKAEPAFKGYISEKGGKPFPAALCASVNSQIVHMAPSNYKLKVNDVLSLDMGIKYKGFYSDMAITLIVPDKENNNLQEIDYDVVRLVKATKKALRLGIKKAMPGNTIGDIGNTIERYINSQKFGIVRELCGHGIGRELHEDPQIPNYGKRHTGDELKPGMVICIEPMITLGDPSIKLASDGFGIETKDGSISAHFEHTILITRKGPQILTN